MLCCCCRYTEGVSDLHGNVRLARPPELLWGEAGGGEAGAAAQTWVNTMQVDRGVSFEVGDCSTHVLRLLLLRCLPVLSFPLPGFNPDINISVTNTTYACSVCFHHLHQTAGKYVAVHWWTAFPHLHLLLPVLPPLTLVRCSCQCCNTTKLLASSAVGE